MFKPFRCPEEAFSGTTAKPGTREMNMMFKPLKGMKKFLFIFSPLALIVISLPLVMLSCNLAETSSPFQQSFKNEPTGFRDVEFGISPEEFLRTYPHAHSQLGEGPRDFRIYYLENQRFWDWEDIVIDFTFFKEKLYAVTINYEPIVSGPAIDRDITDQSADALMLQRATSYYGEPETGEELGAIIHLWRGIHGGVVLFPDKDTLILMDSQLMMEYLDEMRSYGPE